MAIFNSYVSLPEGILFFIVYVCGWHNRSTVPNWRILVEFWRDIEKTGATP